MIESNLLAWSLQAAALAGIAGLTAALLRPQIPSARLFYWQMALLACLALPLLRPWKHEVITDSVSVEMVSVARPLTGSGGFHISLDQAILWLLGAGIVARAAWLAAGFRQLRRYRRSSRRLERRDGAELLLSADVSSPVTFGARRPVVLLPVRFPEFDARVREAILCHELLHVRRRDWIFTLAEEFVRTLLWFHPAIWWLLSQIQLAREQAVDREVVARTSAREEYVDALLAIAGARAQPDLAPAPLFLRQRHLKQRVVSILQEVGMSRTRLISSLAASLSVLAAACWMVTATFPLAAAPELVADSAGVSIDLNGATLMHRTPVKYPDGARARGVQGAVLVQLKIDASGNVADAQVLSGPEELRRAALQSVLNWHFTSDSAGSTRLMTIAFQLPAAGTRPAAPPVSGPAEPGAGRAPDRTIEWIRITGLSDQARTDLSSRLPAAGQRLSDEGLQQLRQTVRSYDEHLAVTAMPAGTNVRILISLPPVAGEPGGAPIRVGGNVQSTKLIAQPKPRYPAEAKQAHVQGLVQLEAVVAKDGTVANLTVISGHPLLVPAAVDSVRQWVYQPTLLNGEPTEVVTQVDVNFTLAP
ncbi:MAG TPA: M56 family metallopeptidase [Bryobacteraceae bacterium]|nr:M56 family metallopeptidase [Bryobacteraceae bacterium]